MPSNHYARIVVVLLFTMSPVLDCFKSYLSRLRSFSLSSTREISGCADMELLPETRPCTICSGIVGNLKVAAGASEYRPTKYAGCEDRAPYRER